MSIDDIEKMADAARQVTANIGDYEPLEVVEIDSRRDFKDYEESR